MSITVNESGVLRELEKISVNESGVLYELDSVHANEGGVLYEIHGGWKDPGLVLWDGATSANSYTADKGHSVPTTGTFTLSSETHVSISGTWRLSGGSGSGTFALGGNSQLIYNKNLVSGDSFSYSGVLGKGSYAITINGGGGNQSGVYGYKTTCNVTFSKP